MPLGTRFGGSRTEVGTFENHVRVTEKVRVCQKRWPGSLMATPRPDSEYAECICSLNSKGFVVHSRIVKSNDYLGRNRFVRTGFRFYRSDYRQYLANIIPTNHVAD